MGTSAIAACPCGYSEEFFIGYGMMNCTTDLFPAYCSEGDHIITANLHYTPLICPDGHKTEPVSYANNSPLMHPDDLERLNAAPLNHSNTSINTTVNKRSMYSRFIEWLGLTAKKDNDFLDEGFSDEDLVILFNKTSYKISFGAFYLTTLNKYFCPSCHQYSLTFKEGGILWD
ncbi:MAG: hypothetical protein RI964_1654 [Pseudomonadota bacterium]|jgi:hypothetical protein